MRSRLIKALNNRFHVKFMQLEIGLLKGKLGQSSVNGLLNNSSTVNPLPLPDIMEVDALRGKMFQ